MEIIYFFIYSAENPLFCPVQCIFLCLFLYYFNDSFLSHLTASASFGSRFPEFTSAQKQSSSLPHICQWNNDVFDWFLTPSENDKKPNSVKPSDNMG